MTGDDDIKKHLQHALSTALACPYN